MTDDAQPKPFVKFRGMNTPNEYTEVPELGDVQSFSVKAECVSVGTEKRADGERRPVIGMRVVDIAPGDITPGPRDEHLPFDEDDD